MLFWVSLVLLIISIPIVCFGPELALSILFLALTLAIIGSILEDKEV